jgi:DNA-binding transcriptional LysR family regulator
MSERNVTRAGVRIGRTQPAMSAALSRLRLLLKDELFVRSAAGLQPTPRALELAAPLGKALASIQRTLDFTQDFDPARSTVRFTLGLSEHPAFVLLPQLLKRLSRQAPGVTLKVRTFTAREDAVSLLDAGEADAAIGVPGGVTPRIPTTPLFEERFVCVARKSHPIAKKKLTLERFLSCQHLLVSPEGDGVGLVDTKLAQLGHKREIAVALPQMYAALGIIVHSDLLATMMERAVRASGMRGSLAVLPLPPEIDLAPVSFVLHWHRRNDGQPTQRWLREQIALVSAAL